MAVQLVAKAVADTRIFDELHLATLVAEYTGGVCASYGPEHFAWTPVGKNTKWLDPEGYLTGGKVCHACQRITCLWCYFGDPTYCRECEVDFCVDCHKPNTLPCLNPECVDVCVPCATVLRLACCDSGRKSALCSTCRRESGYAVNNVCWGCRSVLCPDCATYKCRCEKMWCPACKCDRMEPACCDVKFCMCAKKGMRRHMCRPRGTKRRNTEGKS